jgi:hypothetical protein
MASSIDNVVTVNITKTTAAVTRAGFGTLLIASEFLETTTTPNFTERIRFYSTSSAMLTDGFSSTSPEYLAATAYFSQTLKPPLVAIGRKLTGIDGTETWTDALNAILLENPDFYGVMITSRTQADQELVVAWTETNKRLAGFGTDDVDTLAVTITDLAGVIQAAARERSYVFYHPDADGTTSDPWPEAAWFGDRFPIDPGAATWNLKTLSGPAVYTLTETQRTNALGKNANIYISIGGLNVTQTGTVGSGEYIDIIRGIDWLTARLQEAVFALLANSEKVPYTDPGAAAIEKEVKGVLQEATDNGVLAEDPKYTTTVPLVRTVSTADKVARILPDVDFTGTLAGAIHNVVINGTVSV